jgi:hypothetical protein
MMGATISSGLPGRSVRTPRKVSGHFQWVDERLTHGGSKSGFLRGEAEIVVVAGSAGGAGHLGGEDAGADGVDPDL